MSVTSSEEGEIDHSGDARSFGELLKWFRRREKLTQQQVADQLEVRRSTISEWENSQFAPRYRDRVAKLAEIFHLSPVETNNLLQAAIFHVAPSPPTFKPHNPYKGLAAFTQADHHQFFGRKALLHDLISVLQQVMVDQTKPRLLAVIGPSGSGKTSVIQAGLLPELKLGAIAGSEDWIYLEPIRPTEILSHLWLMHFHKLWGETQAIFANFRGFLTGTLPARIIADLREKKTRGACRRSI